MSPFLPDVERVRNDVCDYLFDKSFSKLPAEELYAIDKDPAQMKNLADDPRYAQAREKLKKWMEDYQKTTADPRVHGQSPWDDYPFYAGKKYLKAEYLQELQRQQTKR